MKKIEEIATIGAKHLVHGMGWLFLGCLVGVLGGLLGGVFHRLLDFATQVRAEHKWLILLLPLGGILIAWFYHLAKPKGQMDTNRIIRAVQSEERVPLTMTPLIFVSTILSHLFGASVGREGAALQLGGSLGYNIGKVFRLNKTHLHMIVMVGMSSVFAALFGTPMTAALFAVEVTCIGAFQYSGLFPCVVSALVGYRTALFLGVTPVRFSGLAMLPVTAGVVARVMVLAFLCAIIGILFCLSLSKSELYMKKLLPNRYLRGVMGGCIVILLTVFLRTTDYNGAGMDVVARAISGVARPEAFLLKIIFTAICIGAGFKGGEIVPTLFVGATFGCVAGPILGLPAGFAAAIGFVALFCAVVNCPIASLLLAIEVFGGNVWIFGIVVSVSFLFSGHFSLYKSQTFAVSKLTDEAMEE